MSFLLLLTSFQLIPPEKALAATGTVRPDGDVTRGWASLTDGNAGDGETCDATHHYFCINESVYAGSDYINTGLSGTGGEIERFTMGQIAGTTQTVSSVAVKIYAWSNTSCNGGTPNCDTLTINISIDGSTQTGQTMTMTTTADTNQTFTFNGSWTGDDDLEIIVTRNVVGSGNPGNRDDDVRLAYVDATVTYAPDIRQTHYRWRDDTAALNTNSGWLASEDSVPASTNTRIENILRLRIAISNNSAGTINSGYRLQWAVKAASCSASTGWTRLDTGSDAWEMVASSRYADGDSLSSSFLTSGGLTFTSGYGLEYSGDDQSAAISLAGSRYTELEWAIKANANATPGQSYCFRAVDDTGQTLSTYSQYPEITLFNASFSKLTQEGYIFENDDGANGDSNSQQAAANTALTNVRKGERLNLRIHLKNTGNKQTSGNFALFYDRGDGFWSKVQNNSPVTASGSGCDTAANTLGFNCSAIDTGMGGNNSSIAFSPSGTPYISYLRNNKIEVAQYVGAGGNGCTSSAWSCTVVDDPFLGLPSTSSIAFSPSGTPYVAYFYYDSFDSPKAELRLAHYVGSGGNCDNTGGSDAWTCDVIASNENFGGVSLSFSPAGAPAISFSEFDTVTSTFKVAQYVGNGTGSGCTGGTTDWNCTALDTLSNVSEDTSIAFSPSGIPYASYYDSSFGLRVAQYVGGGTGSGCSNNNWTCTSVYSTGGQHPSIAFSPSGTPYISYNDSANTGLGVAYYDGDATPSGCAVNAWTCIAVETANTVGQYTSIAFSPAGTPYVSHYDSSNSGLRLARYVGGGGGSGCADSNWTCLALDTANTVGLWSSLAFSPSGNAYISYTDSTNSALRLTQFSRQAEMTLSASKAATSGSALSESHADMTSVTDSGNRDDVADCLTGGASWTNGVSSSAEEIALTIPAGDITPQCSEISFTIDTSQATEGTNYRFIIASADSFMPWKGYWRGPSTISQYPNITIEADTDIRYSKDNLPDGANCTGSSNWACTNVDTSNTVGQYSSLAFSPDGVAYISYNDQSNTGLRVAKYVGSGGSCSGSSAWDCTAIDNTTNVNNDTSIAISPSGVPYISYYDASGFDLLVAKYVGSSGNCSSSSAWECTVVDSANNVGNYSSIAFTPSGVPYISYYDGTSFNLRVAQYVGSGGSGCASAAWTCTEVDTANDVGSFSSLAISPAGVPFISYYDGTTNQDLRVAQYVGSGGSGCASAAWTCTAVETTNGVGTYSSIAFSPSGVPYVSYYDGTNSGLRVAFYDGDGVASGCAVNAWTCAAVDTNNDVGIHSTIAFSPNGNYYISYWDNSPNNDLRVAQYVGSGGSGCAAATWTCTSVDTSNSSGYQNGLAFSPSGVPFISYFYQDTGDLRVAQLHLPSDPLSADRGGSLIPSGDLRYRLSDGRSPRSNYNGTCGTSTASFMGYCGVFESQGDYDSIVAAANEKAMYAGAVQFNANTQLPKLNWKGRSTLAPNTASTAGDIVLQVYRFGSTNAWETIASDTASSNCNTADCSLSGSPTGTVSEYFQTSGSEYWVYFRVYQNGTSSSFTFSVDQLSAVITAQRLRGGKVFEGGVAKPLNTD